MRHSLRRLGSCVHGASAVEFSLIAMPLLMLVFGVCEYGRFLWTKNALAETAIAGARCVGMLQTECASSGALSTSGAKSYMVSLASGWAVHLATTNITIATGTTCGGVSGFATVSVSYTFNSVFLSFASIPTGVALSSSSCFPSST